MGRTIVNVDEIMRKIRDAEALLEDEVEFVDIVLHSKTTEPESANQGITVLRAVDDGRVDEFAFSDPEGLQIWERREKESRVHGSWTRTV